MIQQGIFKTPIGSVQVRADEKGLVALDFLAGKKTPQAKLSAPSDAAQPVARALQAYFSGGRSSPRVSWSNLGGTEFQRRVWKALTRIPRGQTRTYGEIAQAIGTPGAARAVGAACGANPLPLFIPCHRVVASGGKLGGFSGGLGIKKQLLEAEGFYGPAESVRTGKRKT